MEPFSVASAEEALSELFDGLPKSKRSEYLGHLNEIGVVIGKLTKLAGITDKNQEVKTS